MKNTKCFKVFANEVFRYFEALIGPFGLSTSQVDSQKWSKSGSKNQPKMNPEQTKKK
jgi:hypothetical protein